MKEERPDGSVNSPSTPIAKRRKTTSSTPKSSSKRKINIAPDCTDPLTPVTSNQELSTPKSPRKKKTNPEPGSVKPPQGWEDIYSLVEELRQDKSAPVDSDGGEALPQRHLGDKAYRFQVLVALMLSSQTKDAVVGDAMRALQEHGLTVDNICATPPEKLNELIRRVGFHNNKTKYIKDAADVLKAQYDGDIPADAQEMMKLSGVGPKMAFIVENIAWNKCTGIGVDMHMHRMFNELKWVTSKNPEQTRIQLESWLPRDKWTKINYLWVGFGQEVQQFKPKMLQKALECSRPVDALKLIKQLGLDYKKEGSKLGFDEQIQAVLKASSKGS
jgi:endonuclease III